MVMYDAYIRFWPTLYIGGVVPAGYMTAFLPVVDA